MYSDLLWLNRVRLTNERVVPEPVQPVPPIRQAYRPVPDEPAPDMHETRLLPDVLAVLEMPVAGKCDAVFRELGSVLSHLGRSLAGRSGAASLSSAPL